MPVTEEEREEFGEEGQGVGAPNLARTLIDSVRVQLQVRLGCAMLSLQSLFILTFVCH